MQHFSGTIWVELRTFQTAQFAVLDGVNFLAASELGFNNPVDEAISEALERASLGAGHPGVQPIDESDRATTTIRLAQDALKSHNKASRRFGEVEYLSQAKYFRLNVEQGFQKDLLQGINEGIIHTHTEMYLRKLEVDQSMENIVRLITATVVPQTVGTKESKNKSMALTKGDTSSPPVRKVVEIGDLGFVNKNGSFETLFNITVCAEKQPGYDLPPDFEPFEVAKQTVNIKKRALNDRYLSSGVMELRVVEETSQHWKLSCEIDHGAVLILKDCPTHYFIHPSTLLVHYIQAHYKEWYAFMETLKTCPKQILDCSGLLLVTGMHRNSAWSLGAWKNTGGGHHLSHTAPKSGHSHITDICGWEPADAHGVREGPSSQDTLLQLVPEHDPVTQTLFIEGYRIRRRGHLESLQSQDGQVETISPPRSWWEWAIGTLGYGGQGNGENHPDPPGYPSLPPPSTTRPTGGANNNILQEISLTPIYSGHFPRHPLDDLADEIFEKKLLPNVQTVIVHDQDLQKMKPLAGEDENLQTRLDKNLGQSAECVFFTFPSLDSDLVDIEAASQTDQATLMQDEMPSDHLPPNERSGVSLEPATKGVRGKLNGPFVEGGVRLLAFDSGGLGAISQALIVRDMLHCLEEDHQLQSPPKVSDYFDMICGSGLGGLLAIMCGVLHMTGNQLVEEFVGLCTCLFSGELDVTQRTSMLEREMKRLVAAYCDGEEESKMMWEDDTCKPFYIRLFRNYQSCSDKSPDCAIWEASRATTATPGLFNPIVIQDKHVTETFVGGELGWSNPTDELTKEAARVFAARHVTCIISLGSGHPSHLPLSAELADLFLRIALDSERCADDMERRFGNAPDAFRRLSAEERLQNLEVDLSNLDSLVPHTYSYFQSAGTNQDMDLLLDLVRCPERIPVKDISGEVSPQGLPTATRYFTGRQSIVGQLEEYYTSDGDACHVAVLYGTGGSGKTQIGLKFIQQYKHRFTTIFFIDGSSLFTLENDVASIASETFDQPSVGDGIRILKSRCEEWLLFIDNVTNPLLDLQPYISWSHGNVLITSRNGYSRDMRAYTTKCNIWVDQLDLEDAKKLLLRGVPVERSLETQEVASTIVRELGCLALTIAQARAFLAKGLCTLTEYLSMYKRNLLEEQSMRKIDDYWRPISATWTISFSKLSPDAALFLELVSFMHHEAIPACLFEDAWKIFTEVDGEAVPPIIVRFLSSFTTVDSAWNILRFRKLVEEILSFSLLEFNTAQNTFSLHPHVQQWARSHVQDPQAILCASQTLLSLAIPTMDTIKAYAARRAIIPHIQDSLSGCKIHYTLLSKLGTLLRDGGLLQESSYVFRRELSGMQAAIGNDHPDTLTSMENLALTCSDRSRYQDARELSEQALKLRKQILGNEHPDTLTSMNNLAVTYSYLGRYQDARELREKVLKLRRQILGDEHPDTLASMNNLAPAYSNLGRYQDARKLHEQVLKLRRQILGDEHTDTLASMNNLAFTDLYLGRYQSARELHEQVLKLRRLILGDEHSDTLTSMNNLALAYSHLDRHQDARELREEALELHRQILGDEHLDTLISMNSLAFTYSYLGRHQDARELREQVLKLRKQILGEEHPDTLASMSNLAQTYSDLGRYQDTRELREQTVKLCRQTLGNQHPDTLTSMNSLAFTYSFLGRHQDAQELHEHVLKLRRQISRDEHPDTLTSMDNLALTCSYLGLYQDARELHEQVLKLRGQILGDEHPDTLTSMSNLALTYHDLGQHQDALKLYGVALDASRRVLGDDHRDTMSRLSQLESLRAKIGRKPPVLEPHQKRATLERFSGVTETNSSGKV
ncbi:hypothetical protein DL96DRAFT_1556469 [Flagelloscypha sp. PMI_526]|nr:hypothetical protein DL96DRAFT_1556469 [Flagelloscypha sp. PMI_526]